MLAGLCIRSCSRSPGALRMRPRSHPLLARGCPRRTRPARDGAAARPSSPGALGPARPSPGIMLPRDLSLVPKIPAPAPASGESAPGPRRQPPSNPSCGFYPGPPSCVTPEGPGPCVGSERMMEHFLPSEHSADVPPHCCSPLAGVTPGTPAQALTRGAGP